MSTTKNDSERQAPKRYRCLSCGSPSPDFYRLLSANGQPDAAKKNTTTSRTANLQLTECQTCGAVVDPYMELEWLLVGLNLILLRQEAYRHVYWNRLQELPSPFQLEPRDVRTCLSLVVLVVMTARWPPGSFSTWSVDALPYLLLIGISCVLYVLAFVHVRFDTKYGSLPPSQRQTVWRMIHCALWLPVVGGGFMEMIVMGIWSPQHSLPDQNVLLQVVEDVGFAVLVGLWQLSGIRVVLDLPPPH